MIRGEGRKKEGRERGGGVIEEESKGGTKGEREKGNCQPNIARQRIAHLGTRKFPSWKSEPHLK